MKTFNILVIALLLQACSASKALESGNYDLAISRAISKLERQPNNYTSIETLKSAYQKSTQSELEKIETLKNENTAESWESAFFSYEQIIRKQRQISGLESLDQILSFNDFNGEAETAKTKAAILFFEKGEKVLENAITKRDYQIAYELLSKTNKYSPNYKNVTDLLAATKEQGTYHILITIENPNNLALPDEFIPMLTQFKEEKLNKTWAIFYSKYEIGKIYDYNANLVLEAFAVGSDKTETKKYNEERDVITSYKIEKDEKGNVKKDDKGEVIKTPVYTTKKASITKTIRSKEAFVRGNLQLIDNFNMNTFKTVNVSGNYKFESETATYKGDEVALSKDTKSLIKAKLKPFPTYKSILMDAGTDLRSNLFLQLRINQNQFGE